MVSIPKMMISLEKYPAIDITVQTKYEGWLTLQARPLRSAGQSPKRT